jgi:hypothetical protein
MTTKLVEMEKVGESTEVKDVAVKSENPAAVIAKKVGDIVERVRGDFLAANANLGLDFVYLANWITIDGKGKFCDAATETKFGETIDVIIGKGEERFTLWGAEGSEFEGQLLIAEGTIDEAYTKYAEMKENNEAFAAAHSSDDIASRYLMQIVPVESIKSEVPEVFLIDLATSAKYAFGKFAAELYRKGNQPAGIPKMTPVSAVVVRLKTVDKTNANKQNYISIEFEAVEMLKI